MDSIHGSNSGTGSDPEARQHLAITHVRLTGQSRDGRLSIGRMSAGKTGSKQQSARLGLESKVVLCTTSLRIATLLIWGTWAEALLVCRVRSH